MKKRIFILAISISLILCSVCTLSSCFFYKQHVDSQKPKVHAIYAEFDPSDKVVYQEDREALRNHIRVFAADENGKAEEVTDFQISGNLVAGESEITITYGNQTTILKITTLPSDFTCQHALVYRPDITPITCLTEGNVEHYECSKCKKTFSDSGCTVELKSTVKVGPHSFSDRKCEKCGVYDESLGLSYEFNKEGGYYTVVGVRYHLESQWNLIVPDVYCGYPVKEIGDRALKRFNGSITLGENIERIGKEAFSYDTGIASLKILSKNLEYISDDAFKNARIHKAYIPAIACVAVANDDIEEVIIHSGESIPAEVFKNRGKLKKIEIADSITHIGKDAILYNQAVETVNGTYYVGSWIVGVNKTKQILTIRKSAKNMSDGALAMAEACTEFRVDEGSEYFATIDGVLYSKDLKTLISYPPMREGEDFVIPEGVERISDYAFCNTKKLKNLTIPASVTAIGNSILSGASVATLTVSEENKLFTAQEGVLYAEKQTRVVAFASGSDLKKVTLLNTVKKIDAYAFENSKNLHEIHISEGLLSIGKSAFAGCEKLEKLHLDSLDYWFSVKLENATANPLSYYYADVGGIYVDGKVVSSIVVPSGTVEIGDYLFYGNRQLKSITFPSTLEVIGRSAFEESNLDGNIVIPATINKILPYAFCNTLLSGVTIEGSPTMEVHDEGGRATYVLSTANPLYSNYEPYSVADKLRKDWSAYVWVRAEAE